MVQVARAAFERVAQQGRWHRLGDLTKTQAEQQRGQCIGVDEDVFASGIRDSGVFGSAVPLGDLDVIGGHQLALLFFPDKTADFGHELRALLARQHAGQCRFPRRLGADEHHQPTARLLLTHACIL